MGFIENVSENKLSEDRVSQGHFIHLPLFGKLQGFPGVGILSVLLSQGKVKLYRSEEGPGSVLLSLRQTASGWEIPYAFFHFSHATCTLPCQEWSLTTSAAP